MPTTPERRKTLPAALDDFAHQTYPSKELIIVDEPGVAPKLPATGNVRVVSVDARMPLHHKLSIGAKRNLAISLAQGDIICHWDDDDEYGPTRLWKQVSPIIAGLADISGFPLELVRDQDGSLWRCSPDLAATLFKLGIHGGTLMYRKALWGDTAAFANIDSGEDGGFARLLLKRGARLVAVPNDGCFVYVRSARNRWPLDVQRTAWDWSLVDRGKEPHAANV